MSTSYPQNVMVRFEEFELDHSGELRSHGRKIKLQYACLNEKDEAFHWLDKAYEGRSPWLAYATGFFWLDNLPSDSRFDALLRRINFPNRVQAGVNVT